MSILTQLQEEDELIISDDGSTDNTLNIIKSIQDKRISIYYNQKADVKYSNYNGIISSINHNMENAIKQSNGDYIFLSDQDDIWLLNKVTLCMEALQDFDLVVTDCSIINENESIIKKSYFNDIKQPSKNILRNFIHNSFQGCCMAFRKELLTDILPFPNIPIMYDVWIGLVAMKKYKIMFVDCPCLLYRVHDSNVTVSNTFISKNSLFFKVMYRIRLLLAYFKI